MIDDSGAHDPEGDGGPVATRAGARAARAPVPLSAPLPARPAPSRRTPASPSRHRLDGRVAVVAGADGEIGRAVALAFARAGARLVLTVAPGRVAEGGAIGAAGVVSGRERERAIERARADVEAVGGRALTASGSPDEVEPAREAVRRAIEAWGTLDAVVLDSSARRDRPASALVRAARPYLGRGASLASVVSPRAPAARDAPTLVEHASIRAARTGYVRALLAGLALEGIAADRAIRPAGRTDPFERLPPGTGALRGLGRHALSLRGAEPGTIAACLVHLARADADWSGSAPRGRAG